MKTKARPRVRASPSFDGQSTIALVAHAAASGDDLASREESFACLVDRFQDAAFACAHSHLNDPWLAEDAAQEAFLAAWQHLCELRDPAAFPGWLRRLVASQCHRIRRAARLRLVPLESLSSGSDGDPCVFAPAIARAAEMTTATATNADTASPEALAVARERTEALDRAIAALPAAQRLVLMLSDIYDFTQPEIAASLAVPLSTVTRRLFHARRRLRAGALDMFGARVRGHQPSRNARFVESLRSRLRPLDVADWSDVDALLGAEAAERRRQIAAHASSRRGARRRHEYVLDVDDVGSDGAEGLRVGSIVACGAIQQSIFDPIYRLSLAMAPEWLARGAGGAGDLLLARLMSDLKDADAIAVEYHAPAHARDMMRFLSARGFVEVARRDDRLVFERLLRPVEAVDDAVLDAYTGEYAPDAETLQKLPMTDPFTIRVERHGAWLLSKARDMCDRLYPESECAFFVRHHYGRIRFLRDARGRVSHLLYTEGPHQATAAKVS